jgi:hypothetical protein
MIKKTQFKFQVNTFISFKDWYCMQNFNQEFSSEVKIHALISELNYDQKESKKGP